MVVPTKVRAGRVTAVLLGLQSAFGTPVSNFTAAGAGRVWSNEAGIDAAVEFTEAGGWMTQPQMEPGAKEPHARRGVIPIKATPTSLERLLRSNWGPFAAGAFTLASQVNEWLSVGWVESVVGGSTEFFYRQHDAWVHRLTLRASKVGALMAFAEYAAESDADPVALNALGGITLPGAPMSVVDKNIFAGRSVRFFRDPAGANVEIDLHSIAVHIDQNLASDWDMMRQLMSVYKAGHPGPRVLVEVFGYVSDETWAILTDARAGTRRRFRLTATAPSPAKTLTIDFYEMDFRVRELGHRGNRYRPFHGRGEAHRSDSGDFVGITMA